MREASPLGPIDPDSIKTEEEKEAPWIVRKLVGSMAGRIAMSSIESIRAAGTTVICLSPWGDSSPLLLPCIRFRDLAVHTVIVATGGMAAVAAPIMAPVSDVVLSTFGSSILTQLVLRASLGLTTTAANDLVFSKPLNKILPLHGEMTETKGIKVLLITLKYKGVMDDAQLGFFRSSVHADGSLFSAVKDYLAIEKGWFSPYLFASARRPGIPRSVKPDVVFCHGPFVTADYSVGSALLAESAPVIEFCDPAPASEQGEKEEEKNSLSLPSLNNLFGRSRTPSPEPKLAPVPVPPVPRRLAVLLLGINPHRKLWSLSARPEESVINYVLLEGCPAIVLPARTGCPLVAWDALTLEQLWNVALPPDVDEEGAKSATEPKGKVDAAKFEGIIRVLFEYIDMCVEWDRVKICGEEEQKSRVQDALRLLVATAIRSKECKQAREEIDAERAGIVVWRIP